MKLFCPSQLIICSLFIAVISLPPSSIAKTETDRLSTAEPATHRNTLTGFSRAWATIKLTSQLTDRLVEVKGDPPPKLWLKLFALDEGIT